MTEYVDLIAEVGMLNRRWRALMEERLSEFGVTEARWVTLWWAAEADPLLNQKELARKVGIEGPSLVRQLDALEEMKFIERVVGQDRRERIVRVTPKARSLMKKIKQLAEELCADGLAQVDPASVSTSLRVIKSMHHRLRNLPKTIETARKS